MQAVVLAGGEGHRLRPLTRGIAKVMIPVANKPIIDYVLDALVKNGINDIIVVVGYRREQLIRHLNNTDYPVTVVTQKKQIGTANALLCAKDLVKDNFLLLPGDNYIDAESVSRIKNESNAVLISRHPYPSNFGVVKVSDGKISGIREKPGETESFLVSTGIFSLDRDIFEFLDRCEIPEIIEYLKRSGKLFTAITTECWRDAIYPWDLLRMNERTLEMIPPQLSGKISRNAVISGKVSIGKDTTIAPGAVIQGPAIIGEGCEIGPNSCIMPGVSVGNRTKIGAFTCIENSIVMEDCVVGTHSLVKDSVIGSGCILLDHISTVSTRSLVETESGLIHGRFGAILGDGVEAAPFTIFKGAIAGSGSKMENGRTIEGILPENSIVR